MPEFPFWPATVVAPYGSRRTVPIAIDYLELSATGTGKLEVEVCDDLPGQLSPRLGRELGFGRELGTLQAPVVIDAGGEAEARFGVGEQAFEICAQNGIETTLLISADGKFPTVKGSGQASVAIATWPLAWNDIERSFHTAGKSGLRWGVVVPILFPATTEASVLTRLADLAGQSGASFFAALPIDCDPPARRALADLLQLDDGDQRFRELFESGTETAIIEAERVSASLASARGMLDHVPPPGQSARSNWNAAIALNLTATRMLRLGRSTELGWKLARAAGVVARLPKPLEQIALASRIGIVPSLDHEVAGALVEWIDRGEAELFETVNRAWRRADQEKMPGAEV